MKKISIFLGLFFLASKLNFVKTFEFIILEIVILELIFRYYIRYYQVSDFKNTPQLCLCLMFMYAQFWSITIISIIYHSYKMQEF